MFKKIIQIAWILVAVAFLAIMYLHVRGSNVEIYERTSQHTRSFIKVDKLTGSVEMFAASLGNWDREWRQLEGRPEQEEDEK